MKSLGDRILNIIFGMVAIVVWGIIIISTIIAAIIVVPLSALLYAVVDDSRTSNRGRT